MSRWASLVAKVNAIEDSFRRVRLAEERASSLTVDHPVAGDLGTVWVGGSGELLDVRLDAAKIRYTTAEALGQQLLRAISEAEDVVRETKRELRYR
jgi:DNA-binding protein YbaB